MPEKAATRQPVYIDPKTVNLLMHGKLLTDAEKRKLLINIGVDLNSLSGETAGAA
ncbi:hypothetical protein [Phyllobacterium brassicacearum]|uniref:hypothetical protein n=1 Tax=Phyllobacterium brassicacearum TaxID=314235 RepID=UPI001414E973|nr:hypothetical protein [Phyllobacterium brassicacearum]